MLDAASDVVQFNERDNSTGTTAVITLVATSPCAEDLKSSARKIPYHSS